MTKRGYFKGNRKRLQDGINGVKDFVSARRKLELKIVKRNTSFCSRHVSETCRYETKTLAGKRGKTENNIYFSFPPNANKLKKNRVLVRFLAVSHRYLISRATEMQKAVGPFDKPLNKGKTDVCSCCEQLYPLPPHTHRFPRAPLRFCTQSSSSTRTQRQTRCPSFTHDFRA